MALARRSVSVLAASLALLHAASAGTCPAGRCDAGALDDEEAALLQSFQTRSKVAVEEAAGEDPADSRCDIVGARGWVSKAGLSYVLATVFPKLLDQVSGIDIPALSGEASGFKYKIADVVMLHHNLDVPQVEFVEGVGVKLSLTGFHIDVRFHYDVKGTGWNPLFSAGTVRVELIQDSPIHGTIPLSVTDEGKPHVQVQLNELKFKLGGFNVQGSMIGGLVEFLISIFKSKVEGLIATQVRELVHSAVNDQLEDFLSDMSMQIPLPLKDDSGVADAADMSLCFITIGSEYLTVGVRGAILDTNANAYHTGPAPKLHQAPPSSWLASGNAVALELGTEPLNSAFSLLQGQGFLKLTVNPSDLPSSAGFSLDAATARSVLSPEAVPRSLPGLDFAIDISSTQAPSVTFEDGGARLNGHVNMDLRWVSMPGKEDRVFLAFTAPFEATAIATITEGDEEVVHLHVGHVTCTPITIIDGSNTANIDGLNSMVEKLAAQMLVPHLNDMVKDGIKLPASNGLRLIGSKLSIEGGYLEASSNLDIDLSAFGKFIDESRVN